ncbi:TPA: fuconate dehydratase, partial [Yersinia enterocolitica]
ASLDKRVLEYVDHLHENFIEPITINRGRYMPPKLPGYSVTMKEESLARFEYPQGEEWRS